MSKIKIAVVGNLTLESRNGFLWEIYDCDGSRRGLFSGEKPEMFTEDDILILAE